MNRLFTFHDYLCPLRTDYIFSFSDGIYDSPTIPRQVRLDLIKKSNKPMLLTSDSISNHVTKFVDIPQIPAKLREIKKYYNNRKSQ